MTTMRVSLIDLYVLRGARGSLECLLLRRAPDRSRAGAWEVVHGHVEEGERPADAALRELREETDLIAGRLYNLSRVELFYQHRSDEVALVPAFAAFVPPEQPVQLSDEHDAFEWVTMDQARARLAWPRERRALEDIAILLGEGHAGAVEDVLRVC
jgi:8-oxo-dGTP pyrophosphatase MutT (NUDIX family)